ncbi:uncharacterized protein LOC128840022 isoform X3 [Malaclemys terrapin pileata]|uniref:uncharacterized protein LOC128840022 isoform X3 n=1 Tax=Malaclemys terrapin pileata TaxID=2991368 RepID=UPI0023A90B21|nr:uncharacterized protein LOC128840022 isoform X3 [Malaclemys terrapin pileata]
MSVVGMGWSPVKGGTMAKGLAPHPGVSSAPCPSRSVLAESQWRGQQGSGPMEEAPSSQAPCKQSNSQRLPGVKEELPAGPPPDYRQHLYSLLGPGRAEYFLSPPALERCRTPGEQGLLEAVGGAGAEELWRVLHEDPQRQRQAAEARMGRAVAEQVPWLGRAALTPRMQRVARWRRQLHVMHRLGELHQDATSLLLAREPLADLNDSQGAQGPARYLHRALQGGR